LVVEETLLTTLLVRVNISSRVKAQGENAKPAAQVGPFQGRTETHLFIRGSQGFGVLKGSHGPSKPKKVAGLANPKVEKKGLQKWHGRR